MKTREISQENKEGDKLYVKSSRASKNGSKSISTRFSKPDDVALYERWLKRIKRSGSTPYVELQDIIRNALIKQEKEEIAKDFKNDLFYALRKVSWASLTPFYRKIINEINKQNIDLVLLDLKVNMLLNALISDKGMLDEPNNNLLKEPEYAKRLRERMNESASAWYKKVIKKVRNEDNSLSKFAEQFEDNEIEKVFEKENAKLEASELNNAKEDEDFGDFDLSDFFKK